MTASHDLAGEPVGYRRYARTVPPDELISAASALLAGGYRVAAIAGHDDGRRLRAVYLFTRPQSQTGAAGHDSPERRGAAGHVSPERRIELQVELDPASPHLPSLAGLSFPAGRFEREMRDLYGIIPDDHPLPRRLVRHFHWPRGWYPMRDNAGPPPAFGDSEGPYPFRAVAGPGVYEIPVGPVHAGLIEPGHFRFSVVGETIIKLKARLWFVHKGLEKLFQGRRPPDAIALAERISGDTAVGHNLAFCLAVEDALGITAPPQARRARAILLELERLYNHITDIGALCNDVGHGILNAHALQIREQLLRINAEVTGHRLLRGAIGPGTAALNQPPDPTRLAAIAADIAEIVDLALRHSVVRDRFAGTAVLTREQAADLGTLGYVARASGLDIDARRDHPTAELASFVTSTADTGDVLARFTTRAAEIATSVAIITNLLEQPVADDDPPPLTADRSATRPRSGVGIVEGWRGTITHRIELDHDDRLTRVKVVDPSFFNWPALPVALADTIVPDFPLVNKSFNLSYAGNDL